MTLNKHIDNVLCKSRTTIPSTLSNVLFTPSFILYLVCLCLHLLRSPSGRCFTGVSLTVRRWMSIPRESYSASRDENDINGWKRTDVTPEQTCIVRRTLVRFIPSMALLRNSVRCTAAITVAKYREQYLRPTNGWAVGIIIIIIAIIWRSYLLICISISEIVHIKILYIKTIIRKVATSEAVKNRTLEKKYFWFCQLSCLTFDDYVGRARVKLPNKWMCGRGRRRVLQDAQCNYSG